MRIYGRYSESAVLTSTNFAFSTTVGYYDLNKLDNSTNGIQYGSLRPSVAPCWDATTSNFNNYVMLIVYLAT